MEIKTVENYYKVTEGGSMYTAYPTKEEALQAAIRCSVGKPEMTTVKVYHVVCNVTFIDLYDGNEDVKTAKVKATKETLALAVLSRPSMNARGGWTDYEA